MSECTALSKPKSPYVLNSTNCDWLKRIPSHWGFRKLKFASTESAIYGANISASEYSDSGVRFIRTSDIDDWGNLLDKNKVFVDKKLVADYILEDGEILFSRSGTIGRTFLYDAEHQDICAYAGYLVGFKPKKSIIFPKFLFYFSKSRYYDRWLNLSAISSTIGNVNGQKYANMEIPVPTLPEQRNIADFLDYHTARIDALIEKQERLIELLEEKRNALIAQAVTKGLDPGVEMKDSGVEWLGEIPENWKILKIKNIATINDDTLPESTDPDFEIEYVDIGNVDRIEGILDTEHMKFFKSPSRARRIVKDGDIIVSTVRTYLKSITPIKDPLENLIVSTGFAVIRPNEQIKSEYAGYLFISPYFVDKVVAHSTGISYPAINVSTLGSIEIPLPTSFEQEKIANFLTRTSSQIDSLVSKISNLLEYLKVYRKTLISFAVSGKIDVRNWREKEFVETE